MKTLTQLSMAAFVALASATAIDVNKRASPLSVELSAVGNTEVKVAVTNTGSTELNLLSKGTFLDEVQPVQKLKVFSANTEVPFEGMKLRLKTSSLSTDSFTTLAAGETKELTVEAASLHTLTTSGVYDVFAAGAISYAEPGSTALAGSIAYSSNKLSLNVDGAKAAKVAKKLRKRTYVASDCTGSKLSTLKTALADCKKLANAAATAASAGTKMSTYFKSTSSSVKSTVAARLKAVATECGSTTSGATETHCTDTDDGCESDVLAYTIPSENYIVYCPLSFSDLPVLSGTCHAQDIATTILHESTHAPGVYSPGTDDNAYGFSASTALSSSQAVDNADSYALYANSIYVGSSCA
ncbi:neutral protease 2-like protein [Lophium mytilinum]|uniref:Neutral protease 2 n=1 Tax=Lophium mytilinum TaxID=390894 RepID=A0A6A6RE10_9PEZI|nr:neutral protease 2-like protein [Lophium mytilinum]